MGNFNSNEKKNPKLIHGWCILQTPKTSLSIFENERGDFFIYHPNHDMEEILFIEQISTNILVIGIYNDLGKKYGKHTLLKRKDGGFIWEFPYIDIRLYLKDFNFLQYAFYSIDHRYSINNHKIESPLIQPLIHFLSS